MSKAFTREDEAPRDDTEPLAPRHEGPHPVTDRGLRELRDEYEHLVEAGLAHGRRARQLQQILDSVVVLPPAKEGPGAGFGCVVEVEHEDGRRSRYEIVGPDEARPDEGRISIASPLGRALLGHEVGDDVVVRKPRGDETLHVVELHVPG